MSYLCEVQIKPPPMLQIPPPPLQIVCSFTLFKTSPAELMLLGFVSLLLAVFQDNVQKRCIKEDVAKHWLPCHKNSTSSTTTAHFSLLSNQGRRLLAEDTVPFSCPKVPKNW